MSRRVRVNAGQVQITLTNGETYDGPVEVVLTDNEYDRLRPGLFPSILTNLGALPDPGIDASFVSEDELVAARDRPPAPSSTCPPSAGAPPTASGPRPPPLAPSA